MDKAGMFANKANARTKKVELSVGVVVVRALTRGQVEDTKVKGDDAASEANLFSVAVVDPEMTPDEWREWFDTATVGDYALLARAVSEVSGIGIDAQKSPVRGTPKRRKR
jgi:hypothetical protein